MEILIKNGTIIDGSGKKGKKADLIIKNDKIEYIGQLQSGSAKMVIDASDKIVCPGFIDIHSHADMAIYKADHAEIFEPLIRQGITTFIGGNCGMGLAPIDKKTNIEMQKMYIEGFTAMQFDNVLQWSSVDQFLGYLDSMGIALNMGILSPHGIIRLQTIGVKNAAPTSDDMKKMKSILSSSLEEGAFGLSTGLQYFPGLYSYTGELVELGSILQKYDARFVAHLRSYTTNTIRQAMDEVIEVAKRNDIHAQISHIFTMPYFGVLQPIFIPIMKFLTNNPKLSDAIIPESLISSEMQNIMHYYQNIKAKGIRLGMDVLPTTTGFTHLMAFFPPWVLADSKENIIKKAKQKSFRDRAKKDIMFGKPIWPHDRDHTWSLNAFNILGWDSVSIMSVASAANKHLEGKRLSDIAAKRKKHPVDAAIDLLLEEDGNVNVYISPGPPEDPFSLKTQYPALCEEEVSIASDMMFMGFGKPSYLVYGCFPKFLGYHVREKGLLSLEKAIRKCTYLPASQMGLKNRGILKEGYFADVVIFDKNTIGTKANFLKPDAYPSGIEHVIINGKMVWNNGKYDKNAYAGKTLRRV